MPAAAERARAAFITGAASGIGRATAKLLHQRGWLVGAYDVNARLLASLEEELGSARCCAAALDVTDTDAYAAALAAFAVRAGGAIDLMFANAGVGAGGVAFGAAPLSQHRKVMAVNSDAVLAGAYLALPYLRRAPGSLLVGTSSCQATFGGTGGGAAYVMSKFAVRGLMEYLAVELAPQRVRCAAVFPGNVFTGMGGGLKGGWEHTGQVADRKTGAPVDVPASQRRSAHPFRVVVADDVARAVVAAFDDPSPLGRVHHYVPPEIERIAGRAGAEGPAALAAEVLQNAATGTYAAGLPSWAALSLTAAERESRRRRAAARL